MAKSVLLIIVDNPAHRVLFNKYLIHTPHSLVFSTDGEDGFDRFAEVKPDLVLAHVNVARLDGPILCQLIRQQPGGEDVPFVLVGEEFSNPAVGEQKRRLVGADAYLPVPFNKNVLAKCITPLLAFGRPAEPIEEEPEPVPPLPERDDPDQPTVPIPKVTPEDAVETASVAVVKPREESDLDTVVSYQNPFYEGDSQGTRLKVEDPAEVGPHGAEDRSATPTSDPKAIQSAEHVTTSPEHVDPLMEPKIDTGIRRVDRPSSSDLIEEPVRPEATPSREDQRLSQLRHASGGQRRGLDESQLGKRLVKRVQKVYRMLSEVDHYQLLGVEPKATAEQITSAYFDLSLEFHPDRFYLLRSGDSKEKIYAIYRRIGEAYRTLSDPGTRAEYDAGRGQEFVERIEPHQPKRPTNGLDVPTKSAAADRFVGLAAEALGKGDLNGARLHLHLAWTYERSNAALRQAISDVARRMRPTSR